MNVVALVKGLWGWARGHRRTAVAALVGAAVVVAVAAVPVLLRRLGLAAPSFEDVRASSSTYAEKDVEVVRVEVRTEVKWRTRDVSVQRFDPSSGRLVYQLQSRDVGSSGSTVQTHETVRERDAMGSTSDVASVRRTSEHAWFVYVGAGIGTQGVPGVVGASRDILGPLSVGLQLQVPLSGPGPWAALLTVGLRL